MERRKHDPDPRTIVATTITRRCGDEFRRGHDEGPDLRHGRTRERPRRRRCRAGDEDLRAGQRQCRNQRPEGDPGAQHQQPDHHRQRPDQGEARHHLDQAARPREPRCTEVLCLCRAEWQCRGTREDPERHLWRWLRRCRPDGGGRPGFTIHGRFHGGQRSEPAGPAAAAERPGRTTAAADGPAGAAGW